MEFSLPESYKEITLAQLLKWSEMQTAQDISFCKIMEMLTGIPESDWLNCSVTSIDELILPKIKWLSEPLNEQEFISLPVPKKVMIDGKMIEVPMDIDLKTFGQKITFQTQMGEYIIKDGEGNITGFSLAFYPIAIAIYLFDEPKFDDGKAMLFAEKCKALTLTEAYPLASFFLTKFLGSSKEIKTSSLTTRMNKKLERV